MLSEKDNILEFNWYLTSDKMPCVIYADIVSLIKKKTDGCTNNPENSSTTNIGKQYSLWIFNVSYICFW